MLSAIVLPGLVLTHIANSVAIPDAKAVFESAIKAHRNLEAARITLLTTSQIAEKRTNLYEIAYVRPSWATLRVVEPPSAFNASDRTFALFNDTLTAYDATANERLEKPATKGNTLLERLEGFLGELDEPARAALDPGVMELLLLRFETLDGWSVLPKGDQIIAVRMTPGKQWTKSLWRFDAKSHLVRGAELSQPTGRIVWTFSYGTPPASLSLTAPASALRVESFMAKPALPKNIGGPMKSLLLKAMNAFTRLRYAMWTSVEDGRKTKVWIGVNRVREKQSDAEWSYDGKTLTLYLAAKRRAYRGKCGFSGISRLLGLVGVDLDSSTWQYVSRKGAVYTTITPDSKLKLVGETRLDGVVCDILEVSAPGFIGSLFIRRSDSLVAASAFNRSDARGQSVSSSQHAQHFGSVGTALPASAFELSLPAGTDVRPFPDVKPRTGH